MPKKIYHVTLTADEKADLQTLIGKGKTAARKITRARILLLVDAGKKDEEIMSSLQTGRSTAERTRKKFIEGGVRWAINEKPRPGGQHKLDAKAPVPDSVYPTGESMGERLY